MHFSQMMQIARPSDAGMLYTLVAVVVAAAAAAVLGIADVGQLSFLLGCSATILAAFFALERSFCGKRGGSPSGTAKPAAQAGTSEESAAREAVCPGAIQRCAPGARSSIPIARSSSSVSCIEPAMQPDARRSWRGHCLLTMFKRGRRRELHDAYDDAQVGSQSFRFGRGARHSGRHSQGSSSTFRGGASSCQLQSGMASNGAPNPTPTSAEVQRLCDLGRVLTAERLLGELPAEAKQAAEAPWLRQIVDATKHFIEDVGPRDGWKRRDLLGGYAAYNYDRESGDVEFIAKMEINVQPLHLWALLREIDLSPVWVKHNEHSYSIRNFSPSRELYHFRARPLIRHLMAGTESFQVRHYVDALDEPGGFLLCAGFAVPAEAASFEGVDLPVPPKGYKRIATEGRDQVTPIYRDGQLQSVLTVHRRLKTPFKLPDWAVSWVAGAGVEAQMAALRNILGAWGGTTHEGRVLHGPRAQYYAALRPRLEAAARVSAGLS